METQTVYFGQLIPAEDWHYPAFLSALTEDERGRFEGLDKHMRLDETFAWVWDGQVFAIGGVSTMWPGVGEAWIFMTPEALAHPVALKKIAEKHLNRARLEFWRIQATVKTDFLEGHRWARSLGFSLETTGRGGLKKYGPDRADYEMYHLEGCH